MDSLYQIEDDLLDLLHDQSTIPRDPVVPSARKWDWGIIYYSLEGDLYLLRQRLDP